MLIKRLVTGFFVLLAMTLAACGDDGGGGESGVVVIVPDGVIAIAREVDASGFPDPASRVSAVFDIGPSGTMFMGTPAIVGIPIDPTTPANTSIVVARYNEMNDEWDELDGSYIVGSTVFAPTDHFSIFAALGGAAVACDNTWSGGPGSIAPLLVPGSVVVSGATKTDETIAYSGPSAFATSSTWTHPGCAATVTGNFGADPATDGDWVDFSNAGQGGTIPHTGGAFSFDLDYPSGPFLGLADACQAGLGSVPYFLNVHFTGDCVDLCMGVTCSADDGNACTTDTCNPQTGLCEQTPNNAVCGGSNGGLCVEGLCMVEVPQQIGETGNSLCVAEGLVCDSVPVLDPAHAACIAFNPTATVSADANGWKQGVHCDDNVGRACEGRVNDCHNCPACVDTGLGCSTGNTDQIESVYVSCVPAP